MQSISNKWGAIMYLIYVCCFTVFISGITVLLLRIPIIPLFVILKEPDPAGIFDIGGTIIIAVLYLLLNLLMIFFSTKYSARALLKNYALEDKKQVSNMAQVLHMFFLVILWVFLFTIKSKFGAASEPLNSDEYISSIVFTVVFFFIYVSFFNHRTNRALVG